MDSDDVLTRTPPPADATLHYGADANQFGDLRLPKASGPHAVLVFIHGGFWRAKYDLKHAGHLCAALAKSGIATWNLEYRRVGNEGGGWPGTFEDVSNGYRYLRQVASRYSLDLQRQIVMGHSAGGQLAICLAGHEKPSLGAISLAGVLDLQQAWGLHLSHDAAAEFMGGTPKQVPEHYHEASPFELALAALPQKIIHGSEDEIVPVEMSRNYVALKLKKKEDVALIEIAGAGHFDLIDPKSKAWDKLQQAVMKMLA